MKRVLPKMQTGLLRRKKMTEKSEAAVKKTSDSRVLDIALTAVFAALTFVATYFIKVPIPATSGYVHPGDAIVILCGIFLGKKKGFLATGIGSCLADLLGGYMIYVAPTFVIKAFVAFFAAMIFEYTVKLLKKSGKKSFVPAAILAGLADIILVPLGYFAFETVIYGFAAAAAGMLPNLGQAAFGLVVAALLYPLINRALAGLRN